MTRKTGAKAVKAKQLARAAKVARYKHKLKEAGESLSIPKPSKAAQRQKDEELKKLYLELVKEQPKESEQSEQVGQEEQPREKTEEQKQAEQPEEE